MGKDNIPISIVRPSSRRSLPLILPPPFRGRIEGGGDVPPISYSSPTRGEEGIWVLRFEVQDKITGSILKILLASS